MNESCFRKIAKMHLLKAQLKNKERKQGLTLRKMSMLTIYATRLKRTERDITAPSRAKLMN